MVAQLAPEVFADVDTDILRLVAALVDLPRRKPVRAFAHGPARRHGRVTVRRETPEETAPATPAELARAAAENQRNWAWGHEHQPPASSTRRQRRHN